MIYQSVSRKYFAWLYKHVGAFQRDILLCVVLSVLPVMFSLLFVEVTKIFMEAVERGEDFSFMLLIVSLTTLKGCGIACEEFKTYLREKQTTLMNNELALKFFKELFTGGVSYNERVHSGDSLSRLTTDVFSVSNCLIGFPFLWALNFQTWIFATLKVRVGYIVISIMTLRPAALQQL